MTPPDDTVTRLEEIKARLEKASGISQVRDRLMFDAHAKADVRFLVDEVARLRSALQVEREEWQPIETAPNARALFWIDWADDCAPLNGPMPDYLRVFMGWRGCWSSVHKATHWQPLPKPPRPTPDTGERK